MATLCVYDRSKYFTFKHTTAQGHYNAIHGDHSRETLNIPAYMFVQYIFQNTLNFHLCLRVKKNPERDFSKMRCKLTSSRISGLATRFTDGWRQATTGSNRQQNSRFFTGLEKWIQENAFPRARIVRARTHTRNLIRERIIGG